MLFLRHIRGLSVCHVLEMITYLNDRRFRRYRAVRDREKTASLPILRVPIMQHHHAPSTITDTLHKQYEVQVGIMDTLRYLYSLCLRIA